MRGRRPALAVLAALLVAAGCTDDGPDEADRPARRREERPPLVDYSATALGKVKGTTTTSAPPETGTASIVGTVTGPGGIVPGATVRIERLRAGADPVVRDAVSGPDGRYAVTGIPGGRYRVRAFLVPSFAVAEPDVRFLPDGREAVFDLVVVDRRKVVATSSTAPKVPYVGEDVNLAVMVGLQTVDVDGVVRSAPIPGLQVELDGLGSWTVRREDGGLRPPASPRGTSTTTTFPSPQTTVAFTDASGIVRYQLRCLAPGDPGLSLLVSITVTPPAVEGGPPPVPEQQMERLELSLPDCIDPTATTAPAPTSTTVATTGAR